MVLTTACLCTSARAVKDAMGGRHCLRVALGLLSLQRVGERRRTRRVRDTDGWKNWVGVGCTHCAG